MADDSILNAGSKYLVLVDEDNFGVEKYPRFEDKNAQGQYDPNQTPPAGAQNFSNDPTIGLRGDFIAVGAGGDSLAPGDNQTEIDKDDFTGVNYSNAGAKYTDPKLNIIGSITDMLFILERVGTIVPLSVTPATGPAIITSLYVHNGSEDIDSLTVYAGAYYDEESKVRGCQVSKFSLDFQKEDGILQQEVEMYGSHYKQDELKPQSKFARYRNTPIEGWYLDSVWYNVVTKSHVGSFIENSTVDANSHWYQVGCGTSDVKIDLDFNLDEGAGGDFCSKMVNGQLQVVDQYRGKLPRGTEGETLTFTLTREQHEAYFRKIMMGDVGATEDIDNMTFGLKLVLVNLAGESLIIGAPQVSLITDGPHLERKGDEVLTFTTKGVGGFYINDEQVDPTAQGSLFMHYYPTGWLTSIGVALFNIKFYSMATPGAYDHPVDNCRIVVAPTTGDVAGDLVDINWLYDLTFPLSTTDSFNVTGKINPGTYTIYTRIPTAPDTLHTIGNFSITSYAAMVDRDDYSLKMNVAGTQYVGGVPTGAVTGNVSQAVATYFGAAPPTSRDMDKLVADYNDYVDATQSLGPDAEYEHDHPDEDKEPTTKKASKK